MSLDAKNLDGKTALEVAELNEQEEIMELFSKHGKGKEAAETGTSN